MTTKLKQKSLTRGRQEFEILEDCVEVRIKLPFKTEETMTVMLTVLDPEPVISQSDLHFNSRVNGEPLISLFLGKPNTRDFNAFVNTLKQRAMEAFNAFAGLRPAIPPAEHDANVFDEPPDFEEADHVTRIRQDLVPVRIAEALQMLKQNMQEDEVRSLILALEAVEVDPSNQGLMGKAVDAFNELGPNQGAVLTYAPYVSIILSDDPYGW